MTDGASKALVHALKLRGVIFPDPGAVHIGPDIDPHRIGEGVILHPGCRIGGVTTSIGPGSELGREAPMTVIDCQLGHQVSLHGGYAEGAVFLDRASFGSCAHIRPGTLIEEQAGGAHSVGLKQTILFPYVTLGSLINFCDVLMAGGTSRRHHSEVGSSYIHFNFTPHQDKATASLLGDVPNGVRLDQPPIFLGGQGGLVGPCRVAYGSVVAAGGILRQDVLEPGKLISPEPLACGVRDYTCGMYKSVRRLVNNNRMYLGNLVALSLWYRVVRARFLEATPEGKACLDGALAQIRAMVAERKKRLGDVIQAFATSRAKLESVGGMDHAEAIREQTEAIDQWPAWSDRIDQGLIAEPAGEAWEVFSTALPASGSYLDVIRDLDDRAKAAATRWLQGVVDSVSGEQND